jgi:tripartite-type tricarboxylate transporter receptor subunit TctC
MAGGAYRGVAVPDSTPEELRKRISDLVQKVNDNPAFKKKMESGGFVLTDITYDKMDAFMKKMKAEYAAGAKALDIGAK